MTNFMKLAGSELAPLAGSRSSGPVDLDESATITLRITSKGNLTQLEQRALDLAKTPVAERQYLTLDDIGNQYGARPEHLDRIEFFANRHNLTVARRSTVERIVVLTGRLGDFMSAFRVNLMNYHHEQGAYRGRTGPIMVPDEIHDIVTGVFGFDTRPKHRGRHRNLSAAMAGPGGGNGVAASNFAERYKFPTNFDGTNQTIGIIELGGGYQSSDLQIFFREIRAPLPNVTWISVDGVNNSPTGDPGSADGEVMLDIEVAGAVVPGATIAVYFAPNTDQGFQDAISTAIHDQQRNPAVISISWGEPEDFLNQQSLDAYHEIFVAAAALGVTVCAASGDHGSADLDGATFASQSPPAIHVNHPASDPFVLGCGGTQINGKHDVVWNDGTSFDPNTPGGGGWASGGGISSVFEIPDYQTAVKMPSNPMTKKPGRGVPDIALSATNYFTRVDGSDGPSGGTSAATPLMAALIAQMNQSLTQRVGLLQPFLYANATNGIVAPVTTGTNEITGSGVPGYSAAPGVVWNGAAGLGTPSGTIMLQKLAAWTPATAKADYLISAH